MGDLKEREGLARVKVFIEDNKTLSNPIKEKMLRVVDYVLEDPGIQQQVFTGRMLFEDNIDDPNPVSIFFLESLPVLYCYDARQQYSIFIAKDTEYDVLDIMTSEDKFFMSPSDARIEGFYHKTIALPQGKEKVVEEQSSTPTTEPDLQQSTPPAAEPTTTTETEAASLPTIQFTSRILKSVKLNGKGQLYSEGFENGGDYEKINLDEPEAIQWDDSYPPESGQTGITVLVTQNNEGKPRVVVGFVYEGRDDSSRPLALPNYVIAEGDANTTGEALLKQTLERVENAAKQHPRLFQHMALPTTDHGYSLGIIAQPNRYLLHSTFETILNGGDLPDEHPHKDKDFEALWMPKINASLLQGIKAIQDALKSNDISITPNNPTTILYNTPAPAAGVQPQHDQGQALLDSSTTHFQWLIDQNGDGKPNPHYQTKEQRTMKILNSNLEHLSKLATSEDHTKRLVAAVRYILEDKELLTKLANGNDLFVRQNPEDKNPVLLSNPPRPMYKLSATVYYPKFQNNRVVEVGYNAIDPSSPTVEQQIISHKNAQSKDYKYLNSNEIIENIRNNQNQNIEQVFINKGQQEQRQQSNTSTPKVEPEPKTGTKKKEVLQQSIPPSEEENGGQGDQQSEEPANNIESDPPSTPQTPATLKTNLNTLLNTAESSNENHYKKLAAAIKFILSTPEAMEELADGETILVVDHEKKNPVSFYYSSTLETISSTVHYPSGFDNHSIIITRSEDNSIVSEKKLPHDNEGLGSQCYDSDNIIKGITIVPKFHLPDPKHSTPTSSSPQTGDDQTQQQKTSQGPDQSQQNFASKLQTKLGIAGLVLTALVGMVGFLGFKKLFSADQGSAGGESPPNGTNNGVTILPASENVVHVQTEKVLGNTGIQTAQEAFNTSEQASHIKDILGRNAPAEAVLYLKDHATEMRKLGNVGGSALDNPNLENHGLGAFNGGNSKGNLADIYKKIQENATLNGAEQGSLNNTLQRLREATGDTSAIPGTSKEKIEKIIELKDTIARETQAHYDALLKPPVSRASTSSLGDQWNQFLSGFGGGGGGGTPIAAVVSDMPVGIFPSSTPNPIQSFLSHTQEAMASAMHSVGEVAQHASHAIKQVVTSEPVQAALHNSATYTALSLVATAASVRLQAVLEDRKAAATKAASEPPKNLGERFQRMATTAREVAGAFFTKGDISLQSHLDQFKKAPVQMGLLRAALIPVCAQAAIAATAIGFSSLAARGVNMVTKHHINTIEQNPINEQQQKRLATLKKVEQASSYVAEMKYLTDATAFAAKKAEPLLTQAQEVTQTTMAVASETLSKVQDFLKAMPWVSKQTAARD